MAARRKSRSGGAWFGLVAGMVLGVAAAVGVTLFVTQVPMPFKDRASRSTPATLLPDVGNAPDPNIALYGKDGPAGSRTPAQGGSSINPPAPAPEPGSQNSLSDAIGEMIARLDTSAAPKNSPALPPPPMTKGTAPAAPSPAKLASLAPPPPPAPPAPARATPGTQTTYYLQTGAFRSNDEAQAMLARVVMLGLPVHIERADANGTSINRVRVGPFKGIDDMNRARTKLGDDKIESTVVRP